MVREYQEKGDGITSAEMGMNIAFLHRPQPCSDYFGGDKGGN
jgi:hypothetical protein